jgi:hypothetical protein
MPGAGEAALLRRVVGWVGWDQAWLLRAGQTEGGGEGSAARGRILGSQKLNKAEVAVCYRLTVLRGSEVL